MATAAKPLDEPVIKAMFNDGKTVDEIAKYFKVHKRRVSAVVGIPEPPEEEEQYLTVSLDIKESAIDKLIALFTPEEKVTALTAVLCARIA